MTAGLINIVSYGANDLYLTGAPQITFFKVVYRRYTNFSIESISLDMGTFNFNEEINIQFPKVGDLISNTYLQINLPNINLLKTDTAGDLSEEQINILNLPLTPTVDQSAYFLIADNYNNINNYMTINMGAYSVAISTKNIINQSTSDYVTNILKYFGNGTYTGNSNYINSLNNAYNYENTKKINNQHYYNYYQFVLNYKCSDIYTVLSELSTTFIENSTVAQIYSIINNTVNLCIKVKEYFYKATLAKTAFNKESTSHYAKFAWIQKVGLAIIDRIDVNIGGQRIDRHYSDWINIWHELTGTNFQKNLYNTLIGNVSELTTFDRNARPAYTITIPLTFWFCKKLGLAFPLIALQNDIFSITVKLNKFEDCAYVESLPITYVDPSTQLSTTIEPPLLPLSLSDIWDNNGLYLTGSLLVDYIFIDTLERRRFAQSAHEYLIEVVQNYSLEDLSDNRQVLTVDFDGPSKEIIWNTQKTEYLSENSNYIKYPFNYSLNVSGIGNPISNAMIMFNNTDRFNNTFLNNNFFNYVQPFSHHTRTPCDGLNLYSFALFPEEHQPSCTCNFSRIANPQLILNINQLAFKYNLSDIDPSISFNSSDDIILDTTININVYSVRYNILRIIGGMGGLAYQYIA
jgi:hypothetical protein